MSGSTPATNISGDQDLNNTAASSHPNGTSASSIAAAGNTQNNTEVPRDVRLLHLIFATQGVQSYQDHVPLQLMDFAYRYTTGVLQDAVIYNDHAYAALSNAGNVGSHNSQLSNEDIRLAIAARTNYQFKPVPPKKLLMKLAAERNEKPLPPVMPAWGIRLPPEKYCLTAKDWDLSEQESEDEAKPGENGANNKKEKDKERKRKRKD